MLEAPARARRGFKPPLVVVRDRGTLGSEPKKKAACDRRRLQQ